MGEGVGLVTHDSGALRGRSLLRNLPCLAALGAVALGASVALLWITANWGPALSPDSLGYLQMAEGLAAGQPPRARVHAPLFPAVLAAISHLGVEPFEAARWLQAALLAVNVAMVGFLLSKLTGSLWPGLVGSLLMACSQVVMDVHAHLWSEPLFMAFLLPALYLLGSHAAGGARRRYWAGVALLSLACLTRYAGLGFLAAAVLATLAWSRARWRQRLLDALGVLAVSLVPLLAWGLTASGGSSPRFGERWLSWHPVTADQLRVGLLQVAKWVVPERSFLAAAAGAAILLLGGIVAVVGLRSGISGAERAGIPPAGVILRFLLAASVVYTLFLATSITVYDASLDFGQRLFSFPLFPSAVVVAAALVWRVAQRWRGLMRVVILVLCVLLVAGHLRRTAAWGRAFRQNGKGYSGREWRQSRVAKFVAGLPTRTSLFSNDSGALWFLAGRPSERTPRKWSPWTRRPEATYAADMARMCQALRQGPAALVWFRAAEDWYLPTEGELVSRLSLEPVFQTREGAVYQARGPCPLLGPR